MKDRDPIVVYGLPESVYRVIVALFAIAKSPINTRRHRIIQRRLALRLQRSDRNTRQAPVDSTVSKRLKGIEV